MGKFYMILVNDRFLVREGEILLDLDTVPKIQVTDIDYSKSDTDRFLPAVEKAAQALSKVKRETEP